MPNLNFYTLKDWLDSRLDETKINNIYKDINGNDLVEDFGQGFALQLINKIKNILRIDWHFKLIYNYNPIPKNIQIPIELDDTLYGCISENIEGLVNSKEGLKMLNNYKNGVSHRQIAARMGRSAGIDPNSNTDPVIHNDDLSFNKLNIQMQQKELLNINNMIFINMKEDFERYLDTFELNYYEEEEIDG